MRHAGAQQDAAEQVRVRCTEAATHALQTADTPAAVRTAWHRLRDHFDALCATPDDVDAVRQTILQLAVQGKLTEQDPSDEPAEKLLERIQAEKQRLYEAGEIRKPKTIAPPQRAIICLSSPNVGYGHGQSSCSDVATIVVRSELIRIRLPSNARMNPLIISSRELKKLLPFNKLREDGVTSSQSRFQPGHMVYSNDPTDLKKAISLSLKGCAVMTCTR